jgi:HEAT repeat protein
MLAEVAAGGPEAGLQFAAVQGLSGRAAGLATLDTVIQSAGNQAVRLEAIHSVGLFKTDAAQNVLISLAQNASLEPLVRQTAIEQLRRSFGQGAVSALERLQSDPSPWVRDSASKALAVLRRPLSR